MATYPMNVMELIERLSKFPMDALVMIPERDGGAPSLVRNVTLHESVYADQPNPFIWLED